MKTITTVFLLMLLMSITSCSDSTVKDVAAFQFDGAWYWIAEYNPEATKEDIKEYASTFGDPRTTNYFFFYDNSRLDASIFAKEKFNQASLSQTLLDNKPDSSYYKMSTDQELQEDALSIIEMGISEKYN
jgi:hypothetical protein